MEPIVQIINHKLKDEWYKASPNTSGKLVNPSLIVQHYTASGGVNGIGDADYLSTSAAKASAHVVVGRDGSIQQIVPFDVKAWHAGVSIWRGRSNVNDFCIGIEIDNWGPLTRTEDGRYRSWSGAIVDPGSVVKAKHKYENVERYWETFTEKQILAVAELTELLMKTYPSIKEVVGHEDIARGRKSDPGPAFPWHKILSIAEGSQDVKLDRRRVIASALNLRGGAGTQFDRVGTALKKGEEVIVTYDAGKWAQVKVADGRTGWVDDSWLEII